MLRFAPTALWVFILVLRLLSLVPVCGKQFFLRLVLKELQSLRARTAWCCWEYDNPVMWLSQFCHVTNSDNVDAHDDDVLRMYDNAFAMLLCFVIIMKSLLTITLLVIIRTGYGSPESTLSKQLKTQLKKIKQKKNGKQQQQQKHARSRSSVQRRKLPVLQGGHRKQNIGEAACFRHEYPPWWPWRHFYEPWSSFSLTLTPFFLIQNICFF